MAFFITSECHGCKACLANCPNQAIHEKNGECRIDPKKCKECGACFEICPIRAIEAPHYSPNHHEGD